MKNLVMMVVSTLILSTLVGCGSRIPSWYEKTPDDPNYYWSAASATNTNMEAARQAAAETALLRLVQDAESEMDGIISNFLESIGGGKQANTYPRYRSYSERAARSSVAEASIRETEIVKKDGVYTVFVLYRMPSRQAFLSIDQSLSQDDEVGIRWREHELRERMLHMIEEQESREGVSNQGG